MVICKIKTPKELNRVPSNCECLTIEINYGKVDLQKIYSFKKLRLVGIEKGNRNFLTTKERFIMIYSLINKDIIKVSEVFEATDHKLVELYYTITKGLNPNDINVLPKFKTTDGFITLDILRDYPNQKYIDVEGYKIEAEKFKDIISKFELNGCKTLGECIMLTSKEKA